MNNSDWEKIGEEIRRTVQSAVDSQDFEKLNQTITNTINSAVHTASEGIKTMGQTAGRTVEKTRQYTTVKTPQYTTVKTPQGKQPSPFYISTTPKKVKGYIFAACGYSIGAIFLCFFLFCALGLFVTEDTVMFAVLSFMFALWTAGCTFMGVLGTKELKKVKEFKKYIEIIGEREYCDIQELAFRMKSTEKNIVKNVTWFIRKNWFCQGNLDGQKKCLMVSYGAYKQYEQLMNQKNAQIQNQQAEKKRQEESEANTHLSPEIQQIMREGDTFIKRIHACNDAIPGEEISAKISNMELLVDKIFDRVEQNPDSVTEIRRMMEYYLPTTVKLLDAYKDLDVQPVQGENIVTAKKQIEDTLDTLNVAFEKLLDSLFQNTAWDVASDVSVLNTMLAQEGLTDDGLKK